jgi:hypothetical protein
MKIPCAHVISQIAIVIPEMRQFPLPEVGSEVHTRRFEGDWSFGVVKCTARVAREENDEFVESTGCDEARFVNRVWRELELLHGRKGRPMNREEMMIDLGRALGREEAAFEQSGLPESVRVRVYSQFLIDCVKRLVE